MAYEIGAILVTIISFYYLTEFVGYAVHLTLHKPYFPAARKSHEVHHTTMYPVDRFLSKQYRHPPEEDEQAKYYWVPVIPIVVLSLILLPWNYAVLGLATVAATGYLNDYAHRVMHIEGHWLERFRWFHRMRGFHYQHHTDEHTNLGIVSSVPDRVFGTLRKT